MLVFAILILIGNMNVNGQIGVNTDGSTPDPSSGLDVKFNNKGLLTPRMNTAQRDAIASPARGLVIYNLDCDDFQYFNGAAWIPLGNSGLVSAPSAISGPTTPCVNAVGVTYSISPISGAVGYNWTVPVGSTITGGQGTTTITVTIGSTSGAIFVSAYGTCWKSLGAHLGVQLQPLPASPVAGVHVPSQTQIVWNWNAVQGATGYKFNTVNDFSTAEDMGTATTKTETGLTCNTAYTRYVWAYNACVGLSATLTQTTSTCIAPNCLVGYWPFNGNANDESGNGNNGIVIGATLTSDRFGNTNKAYSFDGINDYIHVPLIYSFNSVSVSFWYKASNPVSILPTHYFFVKTNGTGWILYSQLGMEGQTGKLSSRLGTTTTTNDIRTPQAISLNEWHYVCCIFDKTANVHKLYLDGNLVDQKSTTGDFKPIDYVTFGTAGGGFVVNEWFTGSLDDFHIYNCALTSSDVTALYNEGATPPTVTTTTASNVTQNSAVSGGNVIASGGTNVTARGVCYGTSPNPTISGAHTTDGSGTGAFTSNISGLIAGTTYYIRAYATNSVGTAYGNEVSFTTLASTGQPCIGIPSFVDPRDGKTYNTVQIGLQCWMKENLNIGTKILGSNNQTNNQIIEKYCYDNQDANCDQYGGLYQWDEMMNYTTSSNANPSGRQGICPSGWHVPSDDEWCQLETYLEPTLTCLIVGSRGTDQGGKLKSTGTTQWSPPNVGATNASGFTGLPSGYRSFNGTFNSLTLSTNIWTSTEYNTTDAWIRNLSYNYSNVNRSNHVKSYGHPTRCIKD